jgi:hypothetical protein
MWEGRVMMSEEKTFTESEVKAMIQQVMDGQRDDATDLMKKQTAAAKLIGPIELWQRCFTCGVLSNHARYEMVDWEPKDQLYYHSSEMWRMMHSNGKHFCAKCHKAVHMREGKEEKRMIAAGEIKEVTKEEKDAMAERDARRAKGEYVAAPVGGMVRSDAGTANPK